MNIFRLSLRNMTSRPLSTSLSVLLLTLGVGMIALVLQVNRHIQAQMENNVRGIDMVVGAKGSPLQLILSAVYHIDAPTGNISLEAAEALRQSPFIDQGIPLSYGDSYRGYRIVGTNLEYPVLYKAEVAEGRFWEKSLEVTLGSTVAKNLDLQIGDTFAGAHGLADGGELHEGHEYVVVGIMGYTNSVLDQLILTATESVWDVHNHEKDGPETAHEDEGHGHDDEEEDHHEEEAHGNGHHEGTHSDDHEDEGHGHDEEEEDHHEEEAHGNEHHEGTHSDDHDDEHHSHGVDREITAMLVRFKSPMGLLQLPRQINKETNMQAAVPVYEISRLFSLMGVGIDTLSMIALVIMAVSGLSVFISLYNALKDRKYEMALMRTYGASRWQLVWLVFQEGLLLTLTGFALGMICSRLGLWLVSGLMATNYHYEFSGWVWAAEELWLLATAVFVGLLASLLPAIRVFRIDISKTLAHA